MREALAYSLIVGMSAAFLWHFSNIARFGGQFIQEPSLVILAFEIVMLCSIFVFGVVSLIKLCRR